MIYGVNLYALAFTFCVLLATPCMVAAFLYGARVGRAREQARKTEATDLRMRGRCASCGAETVLEDVRLERKTIAVDPGQRLVRPAEQDRVRAERRRRARA